jgi:alpha-mannosidase
LFKLTANCNAFGSEALVRFFLLQNQEKSDTLELSDHADYQASLPQIALKCGIRRALISQENQQTHSFWHGIDNSILEIERISSKSLAPTHFYGDIFQDSISLGQDSSRFIHQSSERLLRGAELFSIMASIQLGASYPKANLDQLWSAYLDFNSDFSVNTAEHILETALLKLTQQIATPADSVIVYNPTDTLRPADAFSVLIPDNLVRKGRVEFLDADETPLISQLLRRVGDQREYLVQLPDVGPLGYQTLFVTKAADAANESSVTALIDSNGNCILENEFVRAIIRADGSLTSLIHKLVGDDEEDPITEREVLALPTALIASDDPITPTITRFTISETGPVRASLCLVYQFDETTVTQQIRLYAHSAKLEFVTEIENLSPEVILQALFPVDILANRVTFGVPFGSIERSTHAQKTFYPTTWVDLSEGDYGVSLFSSENTEYACDENVLTLTLSQPNFTYTLLPHTQGWRSETIDELHATHYPLLARFTRANPDGQLPEAFAFASVDDQGILIESIKRAENSENNDLWIIRLYEAFQTRGRATLTLGFAIESAVSVNLLEENPEPLEFTEHTVSFDYKPFEIKTLLVKTAAMIL